MTFLAFNSVQIAPYHVICHWIKYQQQSYFSPLPVHPKSLGFCVKTTIINYEKLGAVSIRKTVLPGMAIPMLKIRRPDGRLIFNMEIAIRRSDGLYIETGPWCVCTTSIPALHILWGQWKQCHHTWSWSSNPLLTMPPVQVYLNDEHFITYNIYP